jgi:hypothetical protein
MNKQIRAQPPHPLKNSRNKSGSLFLEILLLGMGLSAFFMSLMLISQWLQDSRILYDKEFEADRRQMIDSDAPTSNTPTQKRNPLHLQVIDE